jgi:RNA polymerase sigma-70 factor (ECF subfamily)
MNEADESLIQQYRKSGDKALVAELFNRYSAFVLAICMKYVKDKSLAEEMTVEVFESLFLKLKRHKVDYFKTWLYSVARNHCLEMLRKRGTRQRHESDFEKERSAFMESGADEHPISEDEKQAEQEAELLNEALSELKPEQKECVELFYYQDKSYAEIVSITGHSLKKVKSYLQNGKRNLRIKMESKL